jgi:hypothetical protein
MFSDNYRPFMVYDDLKPDAGKLDLLHAAKDAPSRGGMFLNAIKWPTKSIWAIYSVAIQCGPQ